jgi:hypothetical protein
MVLFKSYYLREYLVVINSLDSGQKYLKVGMMRKGLPTYGNVLKPINHFSTLKMELIN